jgi:hypothetical protein
MVTFRSSDLRNSRHVLSPENDNKTPSSRKIKRIVSITIVACAFFAYSNQFFDVSHRSLRCRTMAEIHAYDVGSEEYERLLLTPGDGPCLTEYPVNAPDEVTYDAVSPQANLEPSFELAQAEVPLPPVNDMGEYILEPPRIDGLVDAPVVASQVEVLDTFEPEIYDPVEAVLRSLDNDAGTTAYAVAITGCPTWYEDTTDAPDTGSELYEIAAVVKSQVCETTEIATARFLMQDSATRGNRKLAAGTMNYTM